jgi:D-alanyl-D-alanine carboxypeptidase (penicillin-binding protein 5/6)
MAARAICALAMVLVASPGHAAPGFAPDKFAAISLDARTGEVLYARNPDARRYPASLTKVMTLYLAFDALRTGKLHMTDRIRMSSHAAAQPPSKLGLAVGASMTVREALNTIVVKSANDVAVALAEAIGGSEAAFVRRMNAKAAAIGMRRTHFANASGLPNPRNTTTARDLAMLARAVMRDHPRRYALFDQSRTHFRGRIIEGHNRLLGLPGIDGLKTGYIDASGFNLMTSGVRHHRRVVAVVLGGSTAAIRDQYMSRLMQASFVTEAKQADKAAQLDVSLIDRPPADVQRLSVVNRPSDDVQTSAFRFAERGASEWRVQVGAFRTVKASTAKLGQISQMHPRHFEPGDARVRPANGLYLARFVADSQDEAREACALLIRDGQECLPIRHKAQD